MHYTIWHVFPNAQYTHSRCFDEVVQSLTESFHQMCHECTVVTHHPAIDHVTDNVVIIGSHLLHPDDMLYLNNPIIYNLEQLPEETDPRYNDRLAVTYRAILSMAGEVWDYSQVNISTLAKMGIAAKLLPIGYSPCLTRIENVPDPDIDVLFYGSLNERRKTTLEKIQTTGAKVVHAFDCYGLKRDALIARSKIVLNVHHYDTKIFELARCSYLMANRKCIVSEFGRDWDLEHPFDECVHFCHYVNISSVCDYLLCNDNKREEIAQAGFRIFSQMSQAKYLEGVL